MGFTSSYEYEVLHKSTLFAILDTRGHWNSSLYLT